LQKVTDVDYTKSGSPACQKKGDTCNMAGYKFIKGTLHDEDGTWIVRARVPDRKTGKIRQRSKTTGLKVKDNTKRKAERKMRDIVAAWEKEANADGCDESPLFSEYVQKFIEHKSLTIRENTICSYQFYADKHINPNIGDMQIKSMKRQHVQDFYNMLRKNGLSVNSIRKIGVVVAGAFHMAILDDVISVNVAKSGDIELPTAEHFEGKTYDEGQLLTLLEKLENEAEPIRCAITLAVCYGLRRSEVCGLRWSDIDFDRGEIYVRNTVTQNGSRIFRDNEPKTKKSRRTLSLAQSTIPYLKQLRESQLKQGLTLDKVCRWPDGREVQPNYITHKSKDVLTKYGLEPIRFHDYRHTAASLMAVESTPKQVQEFLGHNKVSTTFGLYVHTFEADRKHVADRMDSILKKSTLCSEKCSE